MCTLSIHVRTKLTCNFGPRIRWVVVSALFMLCWQQSKSAVSNFFPRTLSAQYSGVFFVQRLRSCCLAENRTSVPCDTWTHLRCFTIRLGVWSITLHLSRNCLAF